MKHLSLILLFVLLGIHSLYAQRRYALLIGISNYPDVPKYPELSWNPIHGANDIELLSGTLSKQGFEISKLVNERAQATDIRKSLNKIADKVDKGDIVYIHFSGHGQSVEDLSGDEDDGWDEAIIPYNARCRYLKGVYEGKYHILDDELEIYFSKIRAKVGEHGFVYVVLDACHMGGASRGDENEDEESFIRGSELGFSSTSKPYIPKIDRRGNIKVASKSGLSDICIIEACRAYQTNAEIKQDGEFYGPLSYYINKELKSTKLSNDTRWIESVRKSMSSDKRLIKQNMVIERTGL